MLQMKVSMSPDVKEISRRFEGLKDALKDWRPTWNRLLAPVAESLYENISSQGSSIGVSWPALSQATLRAKGGRREMLLMTGRLRDSLRGKKAKLSLTKMSMKVGTRISYAGVHNFGSPKQNIPARPFIGISPRTDKSIQGEMLTTIRGHLADLARGING